MIIHEVRGSEDTTWIEGLEVLITADEIQVAPGIYHRGDGSYEVPVACVWALAGDETGVFLVKAQTPPTVPSSYAEVCIALRGAIPESEPWGRDFIDRLAWVVAGEWHMIRVIKVEPEPVEVED